MYIIYILFRAYFLKYIYIIIIIAILNYNQLLYKSAAFQCHHILLTY